MIASERKEYSDKNLPQIGDQIGTWKDQIVVCTVLISEHDESVIPESSLIYPWVKQQTQDGSICYAFTSIHDLRRAITPIT